MKNVATSASLILVAGTALSGCVAIGDIFTAGVWSAFLVVILLVAMIGGVFAILRGR